MPKQSSPLRSSTRRVAWASVPVLVKGVGRVAWRLEIKRQASLPKPPFVLASNHHSFLDSLLLVAAVSQPVRFIALVDLFGNYRWLDRALDVFEAIPLRRGAVPLGPMRLALNHLSNDGVVGLFPEGRRHWEFDPERARPGAAWLAEKAQVPLVPVAILGSERVLGVDNKLRTGRIRMTVGPSLRAEGVGRPAVDRLTRRWGDWVAGALAGLQSPRM